MTRRFQNPDDQPPRDTYGVWAAVIATLLLAYIVFVVAFLPRTASADHDANDEAWRQPLLQACLPNWTYGSTRVHVHAPGYPQHGKTLHDQPWEVRDIFYRHWIVWEDNSLTGIAHLIQWRREYECTHPPGETLVETLVTVGGQVKGGGREVYVPDGQGPGPTLTPVAPLPTFTPMPTMSPTPPSARKPDPHPAVTCPLHAGETWPDVDVENDMYRNGEHRHHSSGVVHAHDCDVVRRVSDRATLTTN